MCGVVKGRSRLYSLKIDRRKVRMATSRFLLTSVNFSCGHKIAAEYYTIPVSATTTAVKTCAMNMKLMGFFYTFLDARCPTLDPNTMHPKLRLSEDLLTVNCAWLGKFNSRNPPRFDKLMQILSRDSYFSGTHYWEVDVLQAGQGWWIGITYPSIQRKGDSELSRLGWTSGSWCIKRYDYEYWAFHKGERKAIHLDNPPEKVGIFLDYESGVLSFFDVTAGMRHLHTFRCRFTEPLYPALRLWDGSITICRLT